MPSHVVTTAAQTYTCTVRNGISAQIHDFLPAKAGKVFVVTTPDVHALYASRLAGFEVLHYPGGEPNKRLSVVEALADQFAHREQHPWCIGRQRLQFLKQRRLLAPTEIWALFALSVDALRPRRPAPASPAG